MPRSIPMMISPQLATLSLLPSRMSRMVLPLCGRLMM